jgi:hypothetical protein
MSLALANTQIWPWKKLIYLSFFLSFLSLFSFYLSFITFFNDVGEAAGTIRRHIRSGWNHRCRLHRGAQRRCEPQDSSAIE